MEYYGSALPALYREEEVVDEAEFVEAKTFLTGADLDHYNKLGGRMVAMNIPGLGERMVLTERRIPSDASLVRDVKDNSVIVFPGAAGG